MNDPTARWRHRGGVLTVALLTPILLGGCGLTSQRAETDSRPVPAASAPAASSPDMRRPPSAGAPSDVAEGGAGLSANPQSPRTLSIEQRHPNGSVLRVTSLTVESNAIRLDVQVVNGADRDFGLAAGGAVVSLTDDLGGVYEFLEPANNPDLEIQQRGTLTGELVYFGVLNPAASSLRLQSNDGVAGQVSGRIYDPATETPTESYPHFSVEIPLNR